MVGFINQSGRPTYMLNHYVLDTEDEMRSLTTDCAMGSQASVVESGNTYMLNSSKEWILQPTGGSGSSGGGGSTPGDSESDIVVVDNDPSFDSDEEIVIL